MRVAQLQPAGEAYCRNEVSFRVEAVSYGSDNHLMVSDLRQFSQRRCAFFSYCSGSF